MYLSDARHRLAREVHHTMSTIPQSGVLDGFPSSDLPPALLDLIRADEAAKAREIALHHAQRRWNADVDRCENALRCVQAAADVFKSALTGDREPTDEANRVAAAVLNFRETLNNAGHAGFWDAITSDGGFSDVVSLFRDSSHPEIREFVLRYYRKQLGTHGFHNRVGRLPNLLWSLLLPYLGERWAEQFSRPTAGTEGEPVLSSASSVERGNESEPGTPNGEEKEPEPASGGRAGGDERGKPSVGPFVPLTSWSEILAALNEPHGNAVWKNDPQTRDKIRKLNEQHNGPIRLPQGKGTQPSVDKAVLLVWWDGIRGHFDARNDEEEAKSASARLTVAETCNYGRSGTVVPGIEGSVKRTRKGRKGKGRKED